MPARDFDYSGVGKSPYQKKMARQAQMLQNKDVLFQNKDRNDQRCNLMFQTDCQDDWIHVLLDFTPENQDMRITARLTAKSGIILVQGSQRSLDAFEAVFHQLKEKANPKEKNHHDQYDDEDDEDGAITVVAIEEIRYRGKTGKKQREEFRRLKNEL